MNTTLTLTGIAHGGEAFGQHEGKIVFVPYTIPGEVVEVEIVEEKACGARARLVDILEASPDRVEPPCPYLLGNAAAVNGSTLAMSDSWC